MIYKITIIFNPKLDNNEINQIKDQINSLIEEHKGEIKSVSQIQRRKLAYSIKRQDYGNYLHWYIEINPDKIKLIDQNIRQRKEILRYLIALIEIKNWAELQNILKKSTNLKARRNRKTISFSHSNRRPPSSKVKLDDLDKKLDEILK
ncbi:MAG TPA: 30S ribosomal protein S6 [Candidatus Portnoybacteria bacterium]|nr:30S ribosomal protein S6 [Candidatus Portnoybacteria bacterium]